jgi:hypothetical protein
MVINTGAKPANTDEERPQVVVVKTSKPSQRFLLLVFLNFIAWKAL